MERRPAEASDRRARSLADNPRTWGRICIVERAVAAFTDTDWAAHMIRKLTPFENFLYLLDEMERAVARGNICWRAGQTKIIQERIAHIAQKVAEAAEQKPRKSERG